jgi:hypothetical protein
MVLAQNSATTGMKIGTIRLVLIQSISAFMDGSIG